MPRKQQEDQSTQTSKSIRKPRTSERPARNDYPETSPIVMNAAQVLETAMRERGLTDKGLADGVRAELGYSISDETIRQKRTGKSMMSLPQMEDFARVLSIPLVLFIMPYSETKFHFAREVAELEALRQGHESTQRDQGIPDSRWNHGTAACDPETDGSTVRELVGVGS